MDKLRLEKVNGKTRTIFAAEFTKLKPEARVPSHGSAIAAGYDLYACIDEPVHICSHETKLIGTGLAIKPPEGLFGAIFARSGLASKQGLRPANCVGVADEDYRGEYMVALHNDSENTQTVNPGDRIAQLAFLNYYLVDFVEVDKLDDTDRGTGGFGSTGVN